MTSLNLVSVERAVSPTERSVVSVQPLHGPVAGGTRVTITGQLLNVSTIRTVYIGEYGLYPYASRLWLTNN